jgi:hypothetical protein
VIVVRLPRSIAILSAIVVFLLLVVAFVWLAERTSGGPRAGSPCQASNLQISSRAYGVDAGGTSVEYVVTNSGTETCEIMGAPTYSLTGPSALKRSKAGFREVRPHGNGRAVLLAPNESGSFLAHVGMCFNAKGVTPHPNPSATPEWTFQGMRDGVQLHGESVPAACFHLSVAVDPIRPGVIKHPGTVYS